MDIEKLTKAELLAKNAELEAKIAETVHIASAIDSKDKEISILKKQIKDMQAGVITRDNEEKERLNNRIKELEKQSVVTKNVEELEKSVKMLSDENKRLVEIANQYISVFRNLLKSLQGQIDIAIELESLINPTLKK